MTMSDYNCLNNTKKHEIDHLSLAELRMLKLMNGRKARIELDMHVTITSHYFFFFLRQKFDSKHMHGIYKGRG